MDDSVWKLSKGSKDLLKKISDLIKDTEDDLISGVLLTQHQDSLLLREYFVNLGKLQGLREIKSLVTLNEES